MRIQRRKQVTTLVVLFLSGLFLEKAFFVQKITILYSSFLHLEAYFTTLNVRKFFLLEHKSLVRKQKWEGNSH